MVQPVPVSTPSASPRNADPVVLQSHALDVDQVDSFVTRESQALLESVAHLLQAELVGFVVVEIAMLADDSATVSYDVSLTWPNLEDTEPVSSTERIIVLIGAEEVPEATAVFEHDGKHVSIWRYPFDPQLPSMPAVLMAQGEFSSFSNVELHSYRPMKRAVASMRDQAGNTVFAKLMAPYRVTRTIENHRRLAAHGVHVPTAWPVESSPDVLMTEAVAGVGFSALIEAFVHQPGDTFANEQLGIHDADAVIHAVLEQVERIQRSPVHNGDQRVRPARRQPIRDLSMRVGQIEAIDPSTRPLLTALTERIGTDDDNKNVMVHGDFHPGQLFLQTDGDDVVVNVIDLDDVGFGHPLDDLSHLLAHLLMQQVNLDAARNTGHSNVSHGATDASTPGAQQHQLPWLHALLAHIDARGLNDWELTRRTAAHMVGLVIGSYRAQEMQWRTTMGHQLHFIADLVTAREIPSEMIRKEIVSI